MLRTLSLTTLCAVCAAALALPAAAESTVKVDVTGLAAPAVHARILEAAKAACRIELRNSTTPEQYYQRTDCINDAVARAEAQLRTMTTGFPAVVAGR